METLLFLKQFWGLRLWIAAGIALITALVLALPFQQYTPIPDFWGHLCGWLFPLASMNVVFHEAGHPIFGIFGSQFLGVAGGTLGEWIMPWVCFIALARSRSKAGIFFCLFWFGMALIDSAFYAADAKQQVLILINGLPGNESGMHDWGYMLTTLHLDDHCVGIGQFLFFCGSFFMLLPFSLGITAAGQWAWGWANENR